MLPFTNLTGDSAADYLADMAAWEAFLRGRTAMNRGTPDDVKRALSEFEAAVQHDPMLAAGWAKIVEVRHLLVMMGALAPADTYPTARAAAQRAASRAYVSIGSFDAALRAARATMPADHDNALSQTTDTGLPALQAIWRWRLSRLEQASRTRWVSPYTLATHLVMVGESQRAIDQLEAAVAQRVAMVPFLNRDPVLDPLRREPRFQALLARVNETSP